MPLVKNIRGGVALFLGNKLLWKKAPLIIRTRIVDYDEDEDGEITYWADSTPFEEKGITYVPDGKVRILEIFGQSEPIPHRMVGDIRIGPTNTFSFWLHPPSQEIGRIYSDLILEIS